MNRLLTLLLFAVCATATCTTSLADYGWEGKRRISYQRSNDLFYNYYAGPQPSGTTAGLYVSPLPTPPQVGHQYTTYQPFMPHEYLYHHNRSYYNYHPGAGWTRTNVRYSAKGAWLQNSPIRLSNLAKHPRLWD